MSSEGVGFFPGHASLAYFFLRGSFIDSAVYGPGAGLGFNMAAGCAVAVKTSTSGAGLGKGKGRPLKMAEPAWCSLSWVLAS